jgi:hypothetical protein
MFLDIITNPIFIQSQSQSYLTPSLLRITTRDFLFQLKPPEIRTNSIDWAQLSRCYLKTEAESNLRNIVF